MSTNLITAPTAEPVTLAEIKTHLRISDDVHNTELWNLIIEGRKYIEMHTGRSLMPQTWDYYMDSFSSDIIEIPYPPLVSITSVKYQDTNDTEQTFAASNYNVDTNHKPGRITLDPNASYPSTYSDYNAVVIRFVSGYANANSVPEEFKRAIKLYVQWMFDMDALAERTLMVIINQNKVSWFGSNYDE